MKTLLISLIPVLAFGWQPPPGYEIVRQDSNRVEVRDLATGYVTPYWIGDAPSVNYDFGPQPTTEDTVRPWYYFERLAVLPWYATVVTADLNHSGLGEIYGWQGGTAYLDTLVGEWEFDHLSMGAIGGPHDAGDTDDDDLSELLASDNAMIRLLESRDYYGYPDSVIWSYEHNSYSKLDDKLGDLDSDGYGEILFYYAQRFYGYNVYELTSAGDYVWKTAIPFRDYVHDYTGEPSWGDVDGDGRNEVFAGGIHGEVIVFENVADDSFEFVWLDSAGAPSPYSTEYLGDTDGDGRNEFMITNRSVFSIFEAVGDNEYELAFRTTIPGYWASRGDMLVGDFTGSGSRQIALCTGLNTAILEAQADNTWEEILRFESSIRNSQIYPFRRSNLEVTTIVNVIRPTLETFILRVKGWYLPGDVNASGSVNVVDIAYLVNYLSGRIGQIGEPLLRADANGNCEVNVLDISYLVGYLTGQSPPPEPGWCHFYVEE